MFHLAYFSSATQALSRQELLELLETSRRRNHDLAVTGLLLYQEGHFLQVLEGQEPVVRGLYHRIGKDGRHHGVVTVFEEPLSGREFPNWSMGFRDLDLEGDPEIRGFSNFMNARPEPLGEPAVLASKAKRLLGMFRRLSN
jgi:hypothetical protein